MAKAENAKSRRRARPLYFSAKISDYQFKRVLWHFVLDHSAAEAAKHVKLSANSIGAIYAKLRKFFFDYGLFNDPYKGGDPREGLPYEGFEEVEEGILLFHFLRTKEKHGALDSPLANSFHHLAETNWRFDYLGLRNHRPDELVDRKMYADLMLFIRCFGPVGGKDIPTLEDRIAGTQLALEFIHESVLWRRRNAPKLNLPEKRKI